MRRDETRRDGMTSGVYILRATNGGRQKSLLASSFPRVYDQTILHWEALFTVDLSYLAGVAYSDVVFGCGFLQGVFMW